MRKTIVTTLISAMSLMAGNVSAASCSGPQRVSSGPATVSVAELYTSEGCDSCPPADKWFSSLNVKKDGVVPLAFHVDYWDYIGWKDRFANAAFGERQRESVRRQGGRTSYTPQVMVNGQDQRIWSDQSRFSSSLQALTARTPRAKHDHVVRALYGPLGGEASGRAEGKLIVKRPITLGQDWKRGDLSLVTFVQNLRTGEIYQALSTPLCATL